MMLREREEYTIVESQRALVAGKAYSEVVEGRPGECPVPAENRYRVLSAEPAEDWWYHDKLRRPVIGTRFFFVKNRVNGGYYGEC